MEEKLHLNVDIDPKSGFCFGVTNAIKMAEEILDKGEDVYCIGQIVHNEKEVERLRQKGLQIIGREELKNKHGKTILFRAHGEPPSTYRMAKQNNNRVIDATCSIILNIHKKIKTSNKKNKPIYIFGKHNHPEVIGLSARVKQGVNVFEHIDELDLNKIPKDIILYSQTTKDLKEFQNIIQTFKTKGIRIEVHDTICRHVANRKKELRKFCKEHDKMLFVAGKKSSNGRVLFNICEKVNASTFFITSPDELKKSWFLKHENIGIAGATSTPQWLMENVKNILKKY